MEILMAMLNQESELKNDFEGSFIDWDIKDDDFEFNEENIIKEIMLIEEYRNALNSLENVSIDEDSINECALELYSESIWDKNYKMQDINNCPDADLLLYWSEELEITDTKTEQINQPCWYSFNECPRILSENVTIDNENIQSKYSDDLFYNKNRVDFIYDYSQDWIMNEDKQSDSDENKSKDNEIMPIFNYETLLDRTDIKVQTNNHEKKRKHKRRSKKKELDQKNFDNKIKIKRDNKYQESSIQASKQNENSKHSWKNFKEKIYFMASRETKKKAIELSKKIGIHEAAKKLNLNKKNIKYWMKSGPERRKGGGRKTGDPKMEEKLIEWYNEEKKCNSITVEMIKWKAKELSNFPHFKGSKGWYDKFRIRYNISITK